MDTNTAVILLVLVVAVLVGVALALRSGGSFRFGISRDRVDVETRGPERQAGQRVDLANEADLTEAEIGRVIGAETSKPVDVTMMNKASARSLKADELVGLKDRGSPPGGSAPQR